MFRELFLKVLGVGEEPVQETNSFYDEVKQKYGDDLPTTMSAAEREKTLRILNIPDSRPNIDDGTLEAWLYRISFWGDIKITHKDPEDRTKRSMTKYQFLDYVDDQRQNQAYGKWMVDVPKMEKVIFHRTFWSIRGKDVKEEMIIDIKLRPDLKKVLTKARRKLGLF